LISFEKPEGEELIAKTNSIDTNANTDLMLCTNSSDGGLE